MSPPRERLKLQRRTAPRLTRMQSDWTPHALLWVPMAPPSVPPERRFNVTVCSRTDHGTAIPLLGIYPTVVSL